MLYEPNEIKTSERQLEKIFKQLPSSICLLGGWATYHIVNKNFEKANGRKYIGSRDIDIGFHINKKMDRETTGRIKVRNCNKNYRKHGLQMHKFQISKRFRLRHWKRINTRRVNSPSPIPDIPIIRRPNRRLHSSKNKEPTRLRAN